MAKKIKNSSKSSPDPQGDVPAGKKKGKGKKDDVDVNCKDDVQKKKALQQANRAKVTSTASWTGKLPQSLLHELCQKRKWNRVEYDMKKIGEKGMLAIAILSYTDPKSKEVVTIRMNDPTYEKTSGKGLLSPQETPMEARHFAATVALYRIANNTNLHMMLPPNHKKLWYDLGAFRDDLMKQNVGRAQKVFDVDPFKTLLEDQKLRTQRDKELEAKNKQAQKDQKVPTIISPTNVASKPTRSRNVSHKEQQEQPVIRFPKKMWENAIFIDLEESSREVIESSLKLYINWNSKRIKAEKTFLPEREALKQRLLSLHFRPPHVEEAMDYKDPLSFLLFNLPEDDLPAFFHKRKEDSKNILEISALPLSVRNTLDRLTESGVSKEEALLALEKSDMEENEAAGRLTEAILPQLKHGSGTMISEQESKELWNQELESLQSIYENSIQIVNRDSCYTIDLVEKFKLKLKVYRTRHYPDTLPGIIVSTFEKNYKLPNYIKQRVLAKLLQYILESHLLGDMLVFNIYEWLQENLEKTIENPGPLLSKKQLEESIDNNQSPLYDERKQNNRKVKRTHHDRSNVSESELQMLKNDYFKRLKSPEYKIMKDIRACLPAWKKQNLIVELVAKHDVVLITGETGSGKSTQVVQFLLDSLQTDKGDFSKTKIICTQPRRISAIGLAERVAEERCVKCGQEVGYTIRGVNNTKKSTRIRFLTTGVLVRILQSDKTFLNNTIVVIDEVHERSIDTDLVVILLKNLLGKIPGLKILLMSATVNVDVFKNFFQNLGTCHIEGRTFPIKDYFLDDVLNMLDFKVKSEKFRSYSDGEGAKDEFLTPSADSKFFRSGQINYDLVYNVVHHVDQELKRGNNDGSIIVFLPGVAEINKCCSRIIGGDNKDHFVVLPLHSALTPEDQRRVFRKYPFKRKVVVSTNIAETSITIDDCVATIDTGRGKTMIYDPKENRTRLIESFISKAEAKQRRGRAGRVREGVSYKLFSKRLYEEDMVDMPEPEIKRVALESLYISVKAMGIKDVKKFLASGLDPPPFQSLEKAGSMLTTVGLLNEFDDSLTELGQFISLMPVMDSKHGKLLIYSIIFGIADIGILIVSILSVNSMPFIGGIENRDRIKAILSKYENRGDILAVTEILRQYLKLNDSAARNKFIKNNLLSYNKLREIMSSRAQYYSILKDVGFLPMNHDKQYYPYLNRNQDNLDILKAILTGAFYPHVARVQLPDAKYSATSVGAIEKDPEAKAIKFWIRNEVYIDNLQKTHQSSSKEDAEHDKPILPATRAFIHPSSVLFSSSTINAEESRALVDEEPPIFKQNSKTISILKSPFIAFNSSQVTNKLYLREVTPTSTLSLLLLGGQLNYDVSEDEHSPGIVLDSWLPIRTWCKNGVLIKELRSLLDQAIKEKLENPEYATVTSAHENIEKANQILHLVENLICVE